MSFITELHDHLRSARRLVSHENKTYPNDVKKYPRMPQIALPEPKPVSMPLTQTLAKRRSVHRFSLQELSLENLGQLFGHALRSHNGRRPHPSGGGLYPVETYFFSFATALPRGIFHYRPDIHSLEHLWDIDIRDTLATFVQTESDTAAGLFLFTAVWERSAQKYHDFAYFLALIEAGHVCQDLLLIATALGLSTRPLASFNDQMVADALDLDTTQEQPVYSALVGA